MDFLFLWGPLVFVVSFFVLRPVVSQSFQELVVLGDYARVCRSRKEKRPLQGPALVLLAKFFGGLLFLIFIARFFLSQVVFLPGGFELPGWIYFPVVLLLFFITKKIIHNYKVYMTLQS